MDLSKLSDESLTALRKSGWNANRQVDVSELLDELTNEGYFCFDLARLALMELQGLAIEPISTGKVFLPLMFEIDGGFGVRNAGHLKVYEPLAGEKLYPFGIAFDHFLLYIGQSGSMYIGAREDFYKVGESLEDGLNNLICGNKDPMPMKPDGTPFFD